MQVHFLFLNETSCMIIEKENKLFYFPGIHHFNTYFLASYKHAFLYSVIKQHANFTCKYAIYCFNTYATSVPQLVVTYVSNLAVQATRVGLRVCVLLLIKTQVTLQCQIKLLFYLCLYIARSFSFPYDIFILDTALFFLRILLVPGQGV